MKVRELDFDHVREERLRSLRASIEVWGIPWEGEAESIPLNRGKFPGWDGSFLILKEDQKIASCEERYWDESCWEVEFQALV